jgi:hypothetical protein
VTRAWYSRFATYLASIGFIEAKSDTSLFIYWWGADIIYLLLYVDDIMLTASTPIFYSARSLPSSESLR